MKNTEKERLAIALSYDKPLYKYHIQMIVLMKVLDRYKLLEILVQCL